MTDSYCDELRSHLAEYHDTRRCVTVGLVIVAAIGLVMLVAGSPLLAGVFGLLPGIILATILGGNEWILRRTARRIAADCPDPPPAA